GSTLKIALWGSAVHQVGNDPIDCESRQEGVLVAVACTFVKSYLGIILIPSICIFINVYNFRNVP
ncbi:hypothetical protein MKW94_008788, partial [Papaver nudicaule]|nr:hypothetical protein [Papaver nudicaule]